MHKTLFYKCLEKANLYSTQIYNPVVPTIANGCSIRLTAFSANRFKIPKLDILFMSKKVIWSFRKIYFLT
jgi:hypothetical protein